MSMEVGGWSKKSKILSVQCKAFNNHVDKRGGVGGLRFSIFVHIYYIKDVHRGRWVVKKEQNHVCVVIE